MCSVISFVIMSLYLQVNIKDALSQRTSWKNIYVGYYNCTTIEGGHFHCRFNAYKISRLSVHMKQLENG
jgi:hypothetical protein